MVGWVIIVVAVSAFAFGVWMLFRSMRKWNVPPPKDPEAQQAVARLWSTMNMDQR